MAAGAQCRFVFGHGSDEPWRVDAYARDVDSDAQGTVNGLVVDR